jgi:hypothetical protein
MLTTSVAYRLIAGSLDRSLAQTLKRPEVARETEYYLQTIGSIVTIDAFIKDTRVFNYAMTAFGLDDMAHAKAFMRKVLTEGVADEKSFAHRLADDRFLAFARTFDFAGKGAQTTAANDAVQGVVYRHVRQVLELSAGEDNEGVRLGLYFLREAPNVTTAYGLLADPALWQVVRTVFGFPPEMANADVEKQAAAVLARLDLADLQDPAKLDRLIGRFTAMWDATVMAGQDPLLALFSATPSIDADLIATLQSLKHGGA